MIHKDYCSRCKATGVPLVKQSKTATTQYYWCRPCTNAKIRAYAKTDRGRQVIEQIKERTKSKYPKKFKARKIVAYALRIGFLEKPTNCPKCGKVGRIDAHHKSYDNPFNIIWLCASCHLLLHNHNK